MKRAAVSAKVPRSGSHGRAGGIGCEAQILKAAVYLLGIAALKQDHAGDSNRRRIKGGSIYHHFRTRTRSVGEVVKRVDVGSMTRSRGARRAAGSATPRGRLEAAIKAA